MLSPFLILSKNGNHNKWSRLWDDERPWWPLNKKKIIIRHGRHLSSFEIWTWIWIVGDVINSPSLTSKYNSWKTIQKDKNEFPYYILIGALLFVRIHLNRSVSKETMAPPIRCRHICLYTIDSEKKRERITPDGLVYLGVTVKSANYYIGGIYVNIQERSNLSAIARFLKRIERYCNSLHFYFFPAL